ncbi:MAG: hydroxymethylbilane synthase, partial [bacterium]|nr:hydroxymethylbilane synthase [bacterium]
MNNNLQTSSTSNPETVFYLGARGSTLSRWQANFIAEKLEQAWPGLCIKTKIISTTGDRLTKIPLPEIGGIGVFTEQLENALENNEIQIAVHSFKDLPVEIKHNMVICAVVKREDPRDALISRHQYTLETLPKGATVGTSSTRRTAQLLFNRPDLNIINIRGNVDTRITKALNSSGDYDAIVLAYAGLIRIGLSHMATEIIDLKKMLPAPAQGALAVQCKKKSPLIKLLGRINDQETHLETTAERSFLKALGGGCSLPVAALAICTNKILKLTGCVIARGGQAKIE